MTTEAELVLMTLTDEELDDASRWVGYVDAHWKALTSGERRGSGLQTDGPWHLMTAMRLAILREQAERGGATPWYLGESTANHPAGRLLGFYARRLELNVAQQYAPRLSRAGVLDQECVVCRERKPLTDGFWPRRDGLWSDICLACQRPTPDGIRDAIALAPPPAPAAPSTAPTDNPEAYL